MIGEIISWFGGIVLIIGLVELFCYCKKYKGDTLWVKKERERLGELARKEQRRKKRKELRGGGGGTSP